jgi:hypothetical protein
VETLKEKIVALRSQGKTYNQIKAELNCSKGTIAYHVGPGQKEKTGARSLSQRNRNMAVLHRYKEESGCLDCKARLPHYVLEFDHKPEFEKIDGVYAVMKNFGMKKAWEEIAKCDVVCANCHKIRTYKRKPWGENSFNPEYN